MINFIQKWEDSVKFIDEIYKSFKNGLTIEEIKLYANPKFTVEEMNKIRKLIV